MNKENEKQIEKIIALFLERESIKMKVEIYKDTLSDDEIDSLWRHFNDINNSIGKIIDSYEGDFISEFRNYKIDLILNK